MQTTIFVLYFFFIILFTNHGNSHIHNKHFIFNGFSNARNNLTLNDASLITGNGLLQLTNQTNNLIWHAFYSSPFNMHIKNSSNSSPKACSFSTSFVFAIVPEDLKKGGASYYIGTNGNITKQVLLESGNPIRVWIEYDGIDKIVNVTLAPLDIPRPVRALLRRLAETLEDWELDCPHRFSYKELYLATTGFKQSEVIGVGGFGEVYKGVLRTTGEHVAVKKIAQNSILGIQQFVAEIESLGRLRHKHLVHLLGWCKQKKSLLLVYNFVPNGSLDTTLLVRNSRAVLSWEQRFKILRDIASALLYLLEDWDQVVIHRDVKASNVLLDKDMNGRLGDFGHARLYAHGDNPRTTQMIGTLGYLAPELARIGKATTSSDVFAYGTLLLMVACGRGSLSSQNIDYSMSMDWVSHCHQSGQILEAMDQNLNSFYNVEEGELVLKLGLLCTLYNPELWPSMRQVSRYLKGDDLLSCNNLASGVHYPCVPDNKAKLAKNVSKNSECGPSSTSFGESFGVGR
ncbi:hypothetical protein Scep_030038 [Stephania cephalantha]|uniref:non-specific serine/threonine protein kinase n=1 Tax=Stephania cephalantha TaxID=152367 RepID=A0AAP0E3B3_9MAGN